MSGIFDGYLLCSDLDGTLAGPDGCISPENREAIRDFQARGGLFTVATGRYANHLDNFPELRPNTCLIVLNGTMLCRPETYEPVLSVPLDEAAWEAVEFARTRLPLCEQLVFNGGRESAVLSMDDCRRGVCPCPPEELLPLHKILFCQDPQNTPRVQALLRERFGRRYSLERSWPGGVELYRGGKGFGVNRLREMLGPRIHTVVCVGDYENDISMLRTADIGYAVANALDIVRQEAHRVTVSHNAHALARVIYDLAR